MLTYTKRTLRFPAVPRLAYDRNLLVPRSLLIARSRTRKIGPGPVPGLFFGRRFATARDAHVHKTYTALALPRLITALNRNPLMRSLLIARSREPRLRPGFFMGPNLSAVGGVPCRLAMLTYTKRTLRFPAVPRLAYDRNLLVPRSLLIAGSRTIEPRPCAGAFFPPLLAGEALGGASFGGALDC